ncbi:MAG TPA: anti-virulence regulator CigR family protein [Gemmatimonadaceae bacterium]
MRMAPLGAALVALSLLVVAPASAHAQGNARGKGAARSTAARSARPAVATQVEVRIIREFFASRDEKPKSLPPGIAKNLARGKPLPPGIAKKHVPAELARKLPARDGAEWIIAGDVVLLIDVSDVVVDIVRAIL